MSERDRRISVRGDICDAHTGSRINDGINHGVGVGVGVGVVGKTKKSTKKKRDSRLSKMLAWIQR
jgi:hypothetical protein